jgi:UPF0042 nucleotide-binding protein
MKRMNGLQRRVAKFVLSQRLTKKFLESVKGMLDMTVPEYANEGKSYLTIAIGCTGGRHRSVAIAESIRNYLAMKKFPTRVIHRDIHL